MVEHPEYIVCPICKAKMSMDYSHKRQPSTEGIYTMYIKNPGYVGAGKTANTFTSISVCVECKGILGVSSSS